MCSLWPKNKFYPLHLIKIVTMIRVNPRVFTILCFVLLSCSSAPERDRVDPQLASRIASIKAIDNHAHPVRPTLDGEKPDEEYDALPVESLEAQSDPIRDRRGSPELLEAHRAMFGGDKAKAARTYGRDYAVRVLDRLNIETMLANRVAVGPGLPSPRFLWVPFADALMYPLPTDSLVHNSDQKSFFALEARLLKRYYAESGVVARPATLDEYLDKVVRATLERQKQAGAVAEKFEMAYLRTLEVGNPSKADAARYYSTAPATIRSFRIIFSDSSRSKPAALVWRFIFTRRPVAADISTSRALIQCYWSRS